MTSLRERKKAETGRRVMSAAIRLFSERGFDATTVEEIAAAAEIAPRTFFRYFPAKVDVLFGDHSDRVELLRGMLAAQPPGEPVASAVLRAALAELDRMAAEPEIYLARTRLVTAIPAARARSRYLDADFEAEIARAEAERTGADPETDLDARLTGRLAWATLRAAQEVWHATGGEADARELLNEAFDRLRARGDRPPG